ncbi:unnamed protein product, partial [marine sediment metagenome]
SFLRKQESRPVPAQAGTCSRVGGKPLKTDTYEITFK